MAHPFVTKPGPKPTSRTKVPVVQSWRPPPHLSEMAAAEFKRIVEILRGQGTIDRIDARLVARYAELNEMATLAYKSMCDDGMLVETDYGPKPNPAVRIHTMASTELRLLCMVAIFGSAPVLISKRAPFASGEWCAAACSRTPSLLGTQQNARSEIEPGM
jgi:P27 family predicted phage terminase small subunit